jgi:Na+-translocating ferredoxin:NAD+ oxidoreductase subunit B
MMEILIVILIFVAIALLLGILIILVNALLPKEKEKSKKLLEILKIIPKRDCGACGYAGCEKYAQVIAENPEIALKDKCPFMIRDKDKLKKLEKILGFKLDTKNK